MSKYNDGKQWNGSPSDLSPFLRGLNLLLGLVLSLAAIGALCFLAAAIYNDVPHWIATVSAFVIAALGLFIGYGIFQTIRKIGFFNLITALHATPELDKFKKQD